MTSAHTPLATTALSRRELNKATTRDAIAEAALGLLRSRGLNGFTVDEVAEAAGISRRTFFNYFSSVEAAVASFTQRYLDSVIAAFQARPGGEPMLESAEHALAAAGSPAELALLAETFSLHQDPALARFQLQAWDDCSAKIIEVARERVPAGTDELFLHTLVGAVVGACRSAMLVWYMRHGPTVSDASMVQLRELLAAALAHLRTGFSQ